MKYRVEVEGTEIILDIRERSKNKIKVFQDNGVIEVEWTLCCKYPFISLLIKEKPYFFFLLRKDGELYLTWEGKPVKLDVYKGIEKKGRSIGRQKGGIERITSPLSGLVANVLVESGTKVKKGEPLLVLEAMKMRNEIKASRDGEVLEVKVAPGMSVELGGLLMTFKVA